MRECIETDFNFLLDCKKDCIWVTTEEELAFLNDLNNLLNQRERNQDIFTDYYEWDIINGLDKKLINPDKFISDPEEIRRQLRGTSNPAEICKKIDDLINITEEEAIRKGKVKSSLVLVFKDYHQTCSNPISLRAIRNIKERLSNPNVYMPIIIISQDIPPKEIEYLFTRFNYEFPSQGEILGIVNLLEKEIKKTNNFYVVDKIQKDKFCELAKGLTIREVKDIVIECKQKYNDISIKKIEEFKIKKVKDSGIVEYIKPNITLDSIGGNNIFKNWVKEMLACYSPEAKDFGVEKPKGYIGVGIPGSCKTVAAEAIAGEMNVPLLKINTSKILDRLVGESEKNIEKVLKLIKTSAPCICLFDELEKELGGVNSSNSSDGGTLSRVFAKILEFLNDNNDVFMVFTSNDISQLPPELTRYGRLDGRWYFGIPTAEERKEIFNIHFKKTNKEIKEDYINKAVNITKNFTGAEIKEVVKNSIRKAFRRSLIDLNKEVLWIDIKSSIAEIIPLATSSSYLVQALENWADKGTVRRTSKKILQKTKNIENTVGIQRVK